MKLGGSIRRRREGPPKSPRDRKGGGKRSGKRPRTITLPELPVRSVAMIAFVAFVGTGLGYLVASRLVFPPPPTPGDLIEVPELYGMTLEDAGALLEDEGLAVGGMSSVTHPTIEAGTVMGQVPLPGQLALAGSGIGMTVSAGPEIGRVPELVRLPEGRAMSLLTVSGFSAVIDSADSDLPEGTVVAVDPPPGSEVPLPAELVLRLSRGPSMIEMPLVVNMLQARAEELLDSLGLERGETETRFRFGLDQGRVVEQRPPAGTMLEPGSRVTIVVGRSGRGGGG